MKRFDIKVHKLSDYWCDFEGELCVLWLYKTGETRILRFFLNAKISFAWDYICLSNKFGIATSTKYFENILLAGASILLVIAKKVCKC